MASFKDNAGRRWTISLTVEAIRRVRDALDIDLIDTATTIPQLGMDPVLAADVAWVLVQPQATGKGEDSAWFGERLGGRAIADCKQAVVEGLLSFFDDPEERQRIEEMLPAVNEMIRKSRETMQNLATSPAAKEQIAHALSELGA